MGSAQPRSEDIQRAYRYAEAGEWNELHQLLEAGLDPNSVGRHGSLLEAAVYGNQLSIVQLLVAFGADMEDKDLWLLTAARADCVDVLQRMLEAGANVEATDERGRTCLMLAAFHGNLDVAAFLVAGYPRLLGAADHEGMNALHHAVSGDDADCVELLAKVVPVTEVDSSGQTPLHLTCWRYRTRSPEIAALLLDLGADIEARDATGRTPLLAASLGGNAEIIELLVSRGAEQTVFDSEGNNALHHAAASHASSLDLPSRFLAAGIRPDVKNVWGHTALEIAAATGQVDLVQLLSQRLS